MPQFESKITFGNILQIALIIFATIGGYFTVEKRIHDTEQAIVAINAEIGKTKQIMEENRLFHIEQRVRLWDRVNEVQKDAQTQNERIARIEAGQEYMIRQLDRIIEKLESNGRKD